jgi:hypothetical protein
MATLLLRKPDMRFPKTAQSEVAMPPRIARKTDRRS